MRGQWKTKHENELIKNLFTSRLLCPLELLWGVILLLSKVQSTTSRWNWIANLCDLLYIYCGYICSSA